MRRLRRLTKRWMHEHHQKALTRDGNGNVLVMAQTSTHFLNLIVEVAQCSHISPSVCAALVRTTT